MAVNISEDHVNVVPNTANTFNNWNKLGHNLKTHIERRNMKSYKPSFRIYVDPVWFCSFVGFFAFLVTIYQTSSQHLSMRITI